MASVRITFCIAAFVLFIAAAHSTEHEPRTFPRQQARFFVPCNYTLDPGASCWDCNTVLICTKIGGILKPCWWPGSRNCAAGACGPDPSEECSEEPTKPTTDVSNTSETTTAYITTTSQASNSTTTATPSTTNAPPSTTNAPPATTNAPPATTNAPPATTNAPPATTNAPPSTTNAPAGTETT